MLSYVLCAHGQEEPPEHLAKIAYIEKITHFIEWPEHSNVKNNTSSFNLCILGDSPFRGALKTLADRIKIKNKSVKILRFSRLNLRASCDILFITDSYRLNISTMLKKIQTQPILTISDTPGFAQKGVIFNFVNIENRLRFEINSMAAQQAGLKISSRLLKLAIITPSQAHSDRSEFK
jgi:uncharacterized protein DUF4154